MAGFDLIHNVFNSSGIIDVYKKNTRKNPVLPSVCCLLCVFLLFCKHRRGRLEINNSGGNPALNTGTLLFYTTANLPTITISNLLKNDTSSICFIRL